MYLNLNEPIRFESHTLVQMSMEAGQSVQMYSSHLKDQGWDFVFLYPDSNWRELIHIC